MLSYFDTVLEYYKRTDRFAKSILCISIKMNFIVTVFFALIWL